jgi:predicted deacylase
MTPTNDDVMRILGHDIPKGKGAQLNLDVARLHTHTPIQVPVIIQRAKKSGPTLLLMAGMHGDEINGIEIVRKVIRMGLNKPQCGTIICIPVFNIFGFLSLTRELPDGRDLNRCFPGTKKGSLASQFAYQFMKEITPHVDIVVDFHTGGAQRDNAPQARVVLNDEKSFALAEAFGAPFVIGSKLIPKSIREAMSKKGIPFLLYEGGTANRIQANVVDAGILGIKRVMQHLGLNEFPELEGEKTSSVLLHQHRWLRAPQSGMFDTAVKNLEKVEKGAVMGWIRDPFGRSEKKLIAPLTGYVFCVNESPVVNKGDALFHFGEASESERI